MPTYIKRKIGELGKVITGRTPPSSKPECFGTRYPFVTPADMHDKKAAHTTDRYLSEAGGELLKNNLLPKNSISVSCIGWQMGKSILITRPSFTNQQLNSIIPNEQVDAEYLYYLLTTKRERFFSIASAAGVRTPILNKSSFCDFEVELPTLTYQKKVSFILSQVDNLIENNNRRVATLEEMAQSLYREWFVKFLYPGNVKNESPLESSTKGWNSKSLGELVDFKRNTIKKGSVPPKTPYMGLEHFPRKSMALENWDEVDEIGSNKLAFECGDILFGKIRPNFHKVGVAQVDGLCSSDTFVLSPVDSEHHALISMVTFSDEFVAQAVQTSQGSKMPRASWDVLKEFPVCIPPQDILDKFNAAVTPAIEQVRVLSLKNRNLKKQRDMLLPKLISGEIEL